MLIARNLLLQSRERVVVPFSLSVGSADSWIG